MHRKQNTDMIPADTKLEKTLPSLRKIKKAENSIMADERQEQTDENREAVRRPPITDTMEDFWRPIIQDEYSAIRQPAVEANNFELKPALITMVQQHQFIFVIKSLFLFFIILRFANNISIAYQIPNNIKFE